MKKLNLYKLDLMKKKNTVLKPRLIDRYPLLIPIVVFISLVTVTFTVTAKMVHDSRNDSNHANWSTILTFIKMNYVISGGLLVSFFGVCGSVLLMVVIFFDNYDHFFSSGLE